MYVTIDKTLDPSVTSIRVNSTGGAFYFGHIENGEFVADTGDIQGSSIDISQYSGDILLGKLVMGSSIYIISSKVFAESYVNVNDSSVSTGANNIFKGYNIKHINVKAYKTATTSIGGMFQSCRGLQQLDISNFDTSLVTNMSQMFDSCYYLNQLDLSSFNTSSVTNMSHMFASCYRLQSLDLSSFNTSSVTNMMSMFSGCYSLQNLNLSNFNTSNVTAMTSMFENCHSLQNLDLSSFSTSNVTTIQGMFANCYSLQQVNLSSFNTGSVKSMSSTFTSCYSLRNLDISNFDTSALTKMGNMFSGCYSLQNLDLSSFNTSSVTNMSSVFDSCYTLKIAKPFQSTLTESQVTSFFDSVGLFKQNCVYRSTYLAWCEITPNGTGTINVSSKLNYRLSDADRALLTNKGYTLTIK